MRHPPKGAFWKSWSRGPLSWLAAVLVALMPVTAAMPAKARETPRIEYRDVLKDPDNIALNFRYARQQVQDGNIKGASATLERILLIQPDLAPVRLFYAAVLIRLDNVSEAEQQLVQLEKSGDPKVISQIARYRDVIADRRKRTHLSLNLALGGQYDTNPSATPSGNALLFGDVTIDSDSTDDDYARIGQTRASFRHDLGSQAGHELFGGVSLAIADQVTEQSLDLFATSVNLGVKYQLPDLTISPELLVTDVNLADQQYYLSLGGRLSADYRLGKAWRLTGLVEGGFQDYDSISVSETANLNSGSQVNAEIGVKYLISPTMQAELHLRHTDKRAETSYNQYYGDTVSGRYLWLFGEGRFLSTDLAVGIKFYDGPDPLISGRTRRDETLHGRVTVGLPVNGLVPRAARHDLFNDLLVLLSGEIYRSLSNITNYTYSNARAQLLISKRWRF